MAKKQKNARKTAAEVVASFTREDIESANNELSTMKRKLHRLDRLAKSERDNVANMEELHGKESEEYSEAIQDAKLAMNELSEAFARRNYLLSKLRRVAFALIRAAGSEKWNAIISENIHLIPTVADKRNGTDSAKDFARTMVEV
jgi:hypothetical protein